MTAGRRTLILGAAAVLGGAALFLALGGASFRESRNLAYADLLAPRTPVAGEPYTHAGAAIARVQGPRIWWTRTSTRTAERVRFYAWQPGRGWVGPWAERVHTADVFGDKDFFRQPLDLPGASARSLTWIKIEISAVRADPELRVAFLDYWRPGSLESERDLSRLVLRLAGVAFFLAGPLWLAWAAWARAAAPGPVWRRWVPRSRREMLAVAGWAAVAVRLWLGHEVFGSTSDMLFWLSASEVLRQHLSLYAVGWFDKGPLLGWLCVLARYVSDALGVPFVFSFRIWILLADLGLTVLTARALSADGNWRRGLLGGLAYGLNPVTLGVFLHGQVDALPLLGLLYACALLQASPRSIRARAAAAFALGLGAGVKAFTLVSAPFLGWRHGKRRALVFYAAAAVAVLLPIAVYGHPAEALRAVFGYSGGREGSWSLSLIPGLMEALNALAVKLGRQPPFHPEPFFAILGLHLGPFRLSAWLLLAGWCAAYVFLLPRVGLVRGWLLLTLTTYALGQNVAPQYWSWAIAAGILAGAADPARMRRVAVYSGLAGGIFFLGLLSDRNLLYPVLGVRLDWPWTASRVACLLGNFLLWFYCLVWYHQEIRAALRNPDARGATGA